MQLPIDVNTVKGLHARKMKARNFFLQPSSARRTGPAWKSDPIAANPQCILARPAKRRAARCSLSIIIAAQKKTQPGWEYHDPDTWDDAAGAMDTLPFFGAIRCAARIWSKL